MKKLLSALLVCSLSFVLLGFKGCCKESCANGAKKVCAPKKSKTAPKKDAQVAYNELHSSDLADDEAISHFAYIDDNQLLVDDFDTQFDDTQLDAANNAIDNLSVAEQNKLNEEIQELVSLWKTDDSDLSPAVDFKTLYLDSASPEIDTKEIKPEHSLASAELPNDDGIRSPEPIITALDDAQDMTREIEADTKEIKPEIHFA